MNAQHNTEHELHGKDAYKDCFTRLAENFIVHEGGSVTYISHTLGPDNNSGVVPGNADDILAKIEERGITLEESPDFTGQSHELEARVDA